MSRFFGEIPYGVVCNVGRFRELWKVLLVGVDSGIGISSLMGVAFLKARVSNLQFDSFSLLIGLPSNNFPCLFLVSDWNGNCRRLQNATMQVYEVLQLKSTSLRWFCASAPGVIRHGKSGKKFEPELGLGWWGARIKI